MLENASPDLVPIGPRLTIVKPSSKRGYWDACVRPIDSREVFEHLRDIRDPEHPHSLEALGVVSLSNIEVDDASSLVRVQFTPTIPGCSMATLIGLSIKVKLLRSLPRRFKSRVVITPGSHMTEFEINKQLADKERIAAALENPALVKMINGCIVPSIASLK